MVHPPPPDDDAASASASDLDNQDVEKPENPADLDNLHQVITRFERTTRVTTQGTFSVQSLGLDALEPSFPLEGLLRSLGLDDDNDENDASSSARHAAAHLRGRFISPFTWPMAKKIIILAPTFLAAMLSAYAAGAYALGAEPLKEEWDVNDTEFNVGITTFVISFGFSPMILAPFSEAYGRYWVFVGAGIVFELGTIGCAVTGSYAGMLVSRFITGMGASVMATITGGVVADMFTVESRNTPMSVYSMFIMVGAGLGPLVSGVVVDNLGWRWIFYVQLIAIGATTLAMALLLKETRGNVLLKRFCADLNKLMDERRDHNNTTAPTSTGPDDNLPSHQLPILFQSQIPERKIDMSIIWTSFSFPLKLLISEPVVFCFSLWAAFAWAILYMQFSSIGIVFRDIHSFTSTQVGAVYTAVIAAGLIGTVLAIVQDPLLRKLLPQRMATPEGRLLSPSLQSILLPAGLFWFGWTSKQSLPWILPALAVGSCTLGIFSIYLAVFNYLADTYGRYSSSAQAAQSMCRNLLAGILPLFTNVMLRDLTYPGAGSMLGGIGLCLTVIPSLLFFFGERIRSRSPFAKQVMEES